LSTGDYVLLTKEELQRFRNAINDDKAVFIFIPSSLLKEKLLRGDDSILNELPLGMAEILMGCPVGGGISTDGNLVMKFLDGSIDKQNGYLFSLGEIRVSGLGDMVIKAV